ncbi:MAG: hypothetical protein EOM68_00445 [Spirochaetia bacterium]|nr:hypothetical protein [Spirochaetia bacterium]
MKSKKAAVLLIVFSILLTLSGGAFAAPDAEEAGVVFEASEADSGGQFTLTMTAYYATFRAFQFAVRFDPAVVQPVDSSGAVTDSFEKFAVKGQMWLSTIGTSVDPTLGIVKFTGYIMPGTSGASITASYEAVAGSDGIKLFTFKFKTLTSGDPAFRIATAAEGEPYDHSLPEGAAISNDGDSIDGSVAFKISALEGGNDTAGDLVTPDETMSADELLADCIILKIGSYAVVADSGLTAFYKGEKSVVPYIDSNGRTFVPLRFIAERLGATVDWEQATKTATITDGGTVVKMSVGDAFFTKNGEKKTMDTAAVQVESSPGYVRTLVPIRFVAEALGKTVGWDNANKLVIIAPGDYGWDDEGDLEGEVITKALTLYTLYGSLI